MFLHDDWTTTDDNVNIYADIYTKAYTKDMLFHM